MLGNDMFQKILVVSPHTDDGELGCGGTIAKYLEDGKDVYYVALSICEKSVPPGYDKSILLQEVEEALDKLGINKAHRFIYRFENRVFPTIRHSIFETLENLQKELKPDLILIPDINDTHQDHSTTAQEAIRAFRQERGSIFSYELPWNNLSFKTACFIKLDECHIKKKIDALKCYKTQEDKRYFTEKFIRAIAEARATQINAKYAEAFDVIKLIY
jgi:LmbE family N-acetylglucosaminyl deacetylase